MTTVDVRRRKSPLTLDTLLKHQRRIYRKKGMDGARDVRILMREDQRQHVYHLLQDQVIRFAVAADELRPEAEVRWNGMHLEVR